MFTSGRGYLHCATVMHSVSEDRLFVDRDDEPAASADMTASPDKARSLRSTAMALAGDDAGYISSDAGNQFGSDSG